MSVSTHSFLASQHVMLQAVFMIICTIVVTRDLWCCKLWSNESEVSLSFCLSVGLAVSQFISFHHPYNWKLHSLSFSLYLPLRIIRVNFAGVTAVLERISAPFLQCHFPLYISRNLHVFTGTTLTTLWDALLHSDPFQGYDTRSSATMRHVLFDSAARWGWKMLHTCYIILVTVLWESKRFRNRCEWLHFTAAWFRVFYGYTSLCNVLMHIRVHIWKELPPWDISHFQCQWGALTIMNSFLMQTFYSKCEQFYWNSNGYGG